MSESAGSWLDSDFAQRFFGPGNRLRWDAINNGSLSPDTLERIKPWIEDLKSNADFICLPRSRENGNVEWYVLASTDRGARALREQLVALLGTSYAGPWLAWSRFDDKDPIDAVVKEFAPGRAYRLRLRDPELLEAVRAKLSLFRALSKERPVRTAATARPVGRILSDFEYALRAQEGRQATEYIAELRRLGRLSAQNHLFLEILRLESIRAWDEILEEPRLNTLMMLTRPRRVTQALIRALYARELQHFESIGDASGAIAQFKEKVLQPWPALFRTWHGMDASEVVKCFMMLAATTSPSRLQLRDALLAAHPKQAADHPYLESLAALVPDTALPAASLRDMESVRNAYDQGEVERAFQEAMALPGSLERLVILLRCARELDTLDAAAQALTEVEGAPPAQREVLLGRTPIRTLWERLLDLTTRPSQSQTPVAVASTPSPTVPVGLVVWLERLGDETEWPTALEVLERGVREWSRDAWFADQTRVAAAAAAIKASRQPWGDETLRNSLPHLLHFLLASDEPERVLKPVLKELAVVVTLDDQVRTEQLRILTEITEALLKIGLSALEYREALWALRETWRRTGAATLADWAIDTLDMLISHPAADPAERTQFCYETAAYLRQHSRRSSRDQVMLFQALAAELELEVPPQVARMFSEESGEDTNAGEDLSSALSGRRIALYSLKEPTLRRVARIIGELAPTARVACFNDKVGGSPALKQQAATADIFVIATAAAKHAATGFIDIHRPSEAITIYAAGQGSASMLQALRDFVIRSSGEAGRKPMNELDME
ncbi:protein DpdD [Corallococcus sp. CA047B]|uniref:protein DpdD n=1 Tax=Corallococcus sp. CA047B TaxID=2316729 RepID=UPI0018F7C2BD|nr:protein DpdD [Corallococcus sp. CA047B]